MTALASTAPVVRGARTGIDYKLGERIGAGGNGAIYAVKRQPDLAAKIQHAPLSPNDLAKLDALIQGTTTDLRAVAACPIEALYDARGVAVGFVMDRIRAAQPLYVLYSPRSRVQSFPAADFRFLIHVAANLARVFATVHAAGFVVGDVNHSNILVRQSGTVAMVDCDSFQVGDGTRFPCPVGTDLFVPPELVGMALTTTPRTLNQDHYGLAVLIFHLLMLGRHPFAGTFTGRGEMPIARAISECRYAFSADRSRTQLAPPRLSIAPSVVGPLSDLFEQAFHPDGRRGGRPDSLAWLFALTQLKTLLTRCATVPWHHHLPDTYPCPWCRLETKTGLRLFGGAASPKVAAGSNLETLWAHYVALCEIGPPRPLPVLPTTSFKLRLVLPRLRVSRSTWPTVTPRVRTHLVQAVIWGVALLWIATGKSSARMLSQLLPVLGQMFVTISSASWAMVIATTLACTSVIVSPLMFKAGRAFLQRKRAQRGARINWQAAAAAWATVGPPPDVSHERNAVDALKRQLDALTQKQGTAVRSAAKIEPEAVQRARYLDRFRIEDAKLPNVGPARCAVLRSFGIDTAGDVDERRIAEIPGFGKSLTDKITLWREHKERGFVPSSAAVVDPVEARRIERTFARRRQALANELRESIAHVDGKLLPYLQTRDRVWSLVEKAYKQCIAVGA